MYVIALMLIGLVCGWNIPSSGPLIDKLPGMTAWAVLAGLVVWRAPAALSAIAIGVATGITGCLLLRHAARRRMA